MARVISKQYKLINVAVLGLLSYDTGEYCFPIVMTMTMTIMILLILAGSFLTMVTVARKMASRYIST